jgi:WD40 repeat protein
MATTPDVPFYAIGFATGAIGIYNEEFAEPMMTFSAHSQVLMGLAVSPFDDTVATVSQDKLVKVWMMRTTATCKHTLEGHSDFVLSVAMSPLAPLMITGSCDQMIKIWHPTTGALLCNIELHEDTVFEVDHHPTQRVFASCGGDGVVCIWDYDESIGSQ